MRANRTLRRRATETEASGAPDRATSGSSALLAPAPLASAIGASPERTLARSVSCSGIGLHGAVPVTVTLRPATSGGIVFRRLDLEQELRASGRRARVEIRAAVENVRHVDHATTLAADTAAGEASVQTVEHLLSALHGLGIDNCLVELDAGEVPILDGSAGPWVELVLSAGTKDLPQARRVRRVVEPFAIEFGGSSIVVRPADALRVTCSIEFAHRAIGQQEVSLDLDPVRFATQVAPARTFGFMRDVEALRAAGLVKGASLENAIVLDEQGVVSGSLRFDDEFVRHKMLDLVGDLALGGMPLVGHVTAHRAGHRLHVEFLRQLLAHPDHWVVETIPEPVRVLSAVGPSRMAAVAHAAE
jgi:UDP-3-O-[3-hydroxymyristoyl] N-acetylglucosamine deacetylase